ARNPARLWPIPGCTIPMSSAEAKACRSIQQSLARSRPGDALAASVLQHLRQCDSCRAGFEMDRHIWQSLGSIAAPPASADFAFRVEQRRRAQELALKSNPLSGWIRILPPVRQLIWATALGLAGLWVGARIGLRLVEPVPVDRVHRIRLSQSY